MSFFRTIRIARPLARTSLLARRTPPPQPHWRRALTTARPTKPCPSCGRPLPSNLPACTSCWSIYPLPASTTHHELFDLPAEPNPFNVDTGLLKRRFIEAQSSCHPDAWATKSSKAGDLAHALSSRLNEAYQTLLQPLARAEYILGQHGYSVSEGDKVDDMGFMMEIMEAREAIEDATAENAEEIEALLESNQAQMQATVAEIGARAGAQAWAEMKRAAVRLRYLNGIARAGQRWRDNL